LQELVLSASSTNTFLRCGESWRLIYIEGRRGLPRLRAIRGIAVHRAVEVSMRQKITSYVDLPVDDMADAYSDSWANETASGYELDEGENADKVKDAGVGLIRLYHKTVAPRIQPELVEEPLQFKINGQAWSGQIDLSHRVFNPITRESRRVIRDTKTTGRTPTEGQHLLAMSGYAISQRQATGEIEADTVLDYLIANKEPTYKEVRLGGPITDDQIRKFARVVGGVADSIKAGNFPANGLVSGACSWCNVKPFCPEWQ
jgi:hypothetical protein